MDQVRAEHLAIVDAIAAHDDKAARRAATEHMQQAARRLEAGGVIAAPQRAVAPRALSRRKGTAK